RRYFVASRSSILPAAGGRDIHVFQAELRKPQAQNPERAARSTLYESGGRRQNGPAHGYRRQQDKSSAPTEGVEPGGRLGPAGEAQPIAHVSPASGHHLHR